MATAAVIGLGRMGRRHLGALDQCGVEVVAICDAQGAVVEEVAEERGLPVSATFSDLHVLLRSVRVDLLVIATTAPSHAELTCAAAHQKIPFILCEKPMATSIGDCESMISACRASGSRLAINHQMRFMDQYLSVRDVIESDAFGGWSSITVVAGNFGIAMNGLHYFELFRWLTGSPAETVTAWMTPSGGVNPRGADFLDWGGSVRLMGRDGKRLYMEAGADQGHGIKVVYAGGTGIAVSDEVSGTIEVSVRRSADRALPSSRYASPSETSRLSVSPGDPVDPSIRVIEELLGGGDHPTGEDGAAALRTFVAAHVSHESGGRPVDVNDPLLPKGRSFPIA